MVNSAYVYLKLFLTHISIDLFRNVCNFIARKRLLNFIAIFVPSSIVQGITNRCLKILFNIKGNNTIVETSNRSINERIDNKRDVVVRFYSVYLLRIVIDSVISKN